jgi:hypothetical protein
MKRAPLRRIAGIVAMLALGVASSPAVAASENPSETGRGWGSAIACAACVAGAGLAIAGGPATLLIAVNTPGSAVAVMACAASCYEAFQ